MRPGERHAETNALLACTDWCAGCDGVRVARAVLAPRPSAAVRRRADRGRHRTGRLRGGRSVGEGRREGLRAPARRRRRGRARDRRPRAARATSERGVPHARGRRAARSCCSSSPRRSTGARRRRRERAAGSRRPRAAGSCTTGGPSMDAVAVGSGTALADDPGLDARDLEPPAERQPLRVVFDRRGRLRDGLEARGAGTRCGSRRRARRRRRPASSASTRSSPAEALRSARRAGRDVAAGRGRRRARGGAAARGTGGLDRAVRGADSCSAATGGRCSGRSGSRRSPRRRDCATCERARSVRTCSSRRSCARSRSEKTQVRSVVLGTYRGSRKALRRRIRSVATVLAVRPPTK